MEKDSPVDYSLFRIPEVQGATLTSSKRKKVIAGLIDASGSMGSYWKAMVKFWNQSIAETADILITFSQKAKVEETTYLTEDLKKHGGGMTNIFAAFQALQDKLMDLDEEASITVVFISDGQDTVNGDVKLKHKMKDLRGGLGRDITLICLGIQSGFPTKMAMDIRELYHTGDEKIPALYLIEYASEKAFFNKFQTMSNCFKIVNEVKCLNAKGQMKEYPWEQEVVPDLKEGKWIMVHSGMKELELEYNTIVQKSFPVAPIETLNLDDVVDCFRGWVQKVQLLSMDVKKMKETSQIAAVTSKIMSQYTKVYEKYHKLYILSERPLGLKESFKERANSLAVKNIGGRIKWFIDELDIIAKGVGIGHLNEYDAAKRIGIGTITGKYHQKALALKGITIKDFEEIKDEFSEVFSRTKLSEAESSQEVSIFTLQNQKEIFQEPDFLEGLKVCKSQFDLVQSFPIVGYSLKVKRYDGSMINPWKVRVLQLAKTHNSIDSVYLANNSNKYELSVGNGKVEEINAVLPLFREEDAEMSELFNTRLFKLAISFMVVQNIDTFHDEAYLALLASTFLFLLKEPESEWRNNLIALIHSSIKVTYWKTKQFRTFIENAVERPYVLFNTKGKEDHVDIAKVILLVFFIGKEKLISKEKLSHLVDLVIVHYVEKTYVENEFKLARVANLEIKVGEQEGLVKVSLEEEKMPEKNIVRDSKHLKKIADQEVGSVMNNDAFDIEFSSKIFMHTDEERRVTYDHIRSFYAKSKQQKFDPVDFAYYFGHSLKGKDEQIYNMPVSKDIDNVKKEVLKKIDTKSLGANQGKKIKSMKKMIQDRYLQNFQKTHFGIAPMSAAKFADVCYSMKVKKEDFHYNNISGMISNCCMSPNCVLYMKPLKHQQFSEHMRLWKKSMPSRFHIEVSTKLRQKATVQQVYDHLIKSGRVKLDRHNKTKQEVMEYIQLIKDSLKE